MSRYTSFVVLENDAAFKKFKIARTQGNASKGLEYGGLGFLEVKAL